MNIRPMTELEVYLRERDIALTNMDLGWARKTLPRAVNDFALTAAMHKARYQCTAISRELRFESARWLEEHAMGSLISEIDMEPEGVLPGDEWR